MREEEKISRDYRNRYQGKKNNLKKRKNVNYRKGERHPFVNIFLFLTLISSLLYFGVTLWFGDGNSNFIYSFISSVILVIFSILFIAICITNPTRKKGKILLGCFFLLVFNMLGSAFTSGIISFPNYGMVEDFYGKSLTDVVSWASKNEVSLTQDYEYSDMVPEYHIISQNVSSNQRSKDIDELTVAVSEGPNPDKEIIIPDMTNWNSERVINYVENNYLSNVDVSFVESDIEEDLVIEQSVTGSMKRSDALTITFSLGEEADNSDISLADLVDTSEFRAIFYLKQHRIAYEIERDFSDDIERGNVSKQSIESGSMVSVNNEEEKLILTISKGGSIKVPNIKKMSMVEITEWIIENKLKLKFMNQYDDSISEGDVIRANYEKGDTIEQGSTVEVVISKGPLIMKDFDSFEKFTSWAQKYNISYEEVHEFSDEVEQGKVISYSYKKGDVIKNGDSIVVTISDGSECRVPDLIGMSKNEAIKTLEKVGLNYNFVTQNSTKDKNTVIKQSISAGSKVSSGTTITVTLSNGKETEYREEGNSSSSNSSSSGASYGSSNSNSGSSSNSNSNNNSKPDSTDKPEVVCNSCSIRSGELKSVILNNTGSFDGAANAVRGFFASKCPGVTVNISGDSSSGFTPGSYVGGFEGGGFSSCDTINIILAK